MNSATDRRPFRPRNWQYRAFDLLLSANVAYTINCALALYIVRSSSTWPPHDDAGYYVLRGVARVSDLLHLGMLNPVSTEAVARRGHFPGLSAVGIVFVISAFSITDLLFLLIRILRSRIKRHRLFERTSWVTAVFGPPAACLLTLGLTWHWSIAFGSSSSAIPFRKSFLFSIFIGELIGVVILSLTARKFSISGWMAAILLVAHIGFWGGFVLPGVVLPGPGDIWFYGLPAPWALRAMVLCLWLVPAVGVALLSWVIADRDDASDSSLGAIGIPTIAAAALGVVALLTIWLPGKSFYFLRRNDLNSAVIELSRGPCYGQCPAYTVTIRGDGSVVYAGKEFANRNRQAGILGRDEVSSILQILKRADFFTLEDRAFSWCFDTPSVSVTVTSEGRSKRVVSDTGCVGAKSGAQARFVGAVDEIEKIVGSGRYLKCDGRCRT